MGHQQAMVNYSILLGSMDIDVFAPPHLGDPEEANSPKAFDLHSTIKNYPLTSRYDFFYQAMSTVDADEIYKNILSMKFDYIFSYFVVPEILNLHLINSPCKVFLLCWGDEENFSTNKYSKHILQAVNQSNNCEFVLCHKHLHSSIPPSLLGGKIKLANIPLLSTKNIEGTWNQKSEDNTVLIVSSRIFSSNRKVFDCFEPCRSWLLRVVSSNPHINFLIVGKCNSNTSPSSLPPNLEMFEASELAEVYGLMQSSKLMFYFHPIFPAGRVSGNILQYSCIEASCIGLPILHCSKSPAQNYIGLNQNFSYTAFDKRNPLSNHNEISVKINTLINKTRRDLSISSSYQSSLYKEYSGENVINQYQKLL